MHEFIKWTIYLSRASKAGLLDWIIATRAKWRLPAAANLKLPARLIHMQMSRHSIFLCMYTTSHINSFTYGHVCCGSWSNNKTDIQVAIWWLLAATSDEWMDHISSCVSYLYSSTYCKEAGTYPNQSGCTTRSTSSQRRRKQLTECGDRGPPPAARSNSPWSHTGRRPPLLYSPPTGEPGRQWLIAAPVSVDKWHSITVQMMETHFVSSGCGFLVNYSKISINDSLRRKRFC